MGTSERQHKWLAVPQAIELKESTGRGAVVTSRSLDAFGRATVKTPMGKSPAIIRTKVEAEDLATLPPKSGELDELLDACGRNPSVTLRLEVPDSLSAMVAAIDHPSAPPPAPAGARRSSAPTISAKAQLGIGTARIARPRGRNDWKIWSAPLGAGAVLAFAMFHSGARGSAHAAAPARTVSAPMAVAAAGQPVKEAPILAAVAPIDAPVAVSIRRLERAAAPSPAAPAAGNAMAAAPAGRSLELARDAARRGDNDTASQMFARAIAENDEPCEAWTERAGLDLAAGHAGDALQMYENALATNGRYVPALVGRADANWAQGNADLAAKQYASIVANVAGDLYPKRVSERAATIVTAGTGAVAAETP